MSITAKVKKRVIDTGRIFDVLVQGENRSHTIIFAIPNETLEPQVGTTIDLKDCYFYLLYKRKGDETTQVPLLLDKTYDSTTDTISASFEPTSYFTEKEGGMDIQVFACSDAQTFDIADVDLDDVALWTTFNAQISIAKSQLKNSQTIVADDMFIKGVAVMTEILDSAEGEADDAEEFASDAEEFAKGTRSDGRPVTHGTDNAKYYSEHASASSSSAAGSSTDAYTYKLGAEAARDKAEDWATKTNGKIDNIDYSAKHYAFEAKASEQNASEWAERETAVETGKYSAKHWAEQAHAEFTALDTYVDETLKPALDGYEETKEGELDTYTATKKAELDTYEGTKETELNTYTGTKKTELDIYTGAKKTELDSYVANTNKPALDSYTNNTLKPALLAYEQTQEGTLNTYTGTKKSELDSYVENTTKPSIDDYIEDEKKPEIDAYIEQQAGQFGDDVTALKGNVAALDKRVSNLEESLDVITEIDYPDSTYGTGEVPPNKSKYAEVTKLRGVSRVNNQQLGSANATTDFCLFSDGVWTLNKTVADPRTAIKIIPLVSGHKYLFSYVLKTGTMTDIFRLYSSGTGYIDQLFGSSSRAWVFDCTSSSNYEINVMVASSTTINITFTLICTDLNVYFNTSDLSFLGATDSAKLATIQQKYPELLIPSDYNAGSLVDTMYSAVEAQGVNIWDEVARDGYLLANGTFASGYGTTASANYIPVKPSTSYYLKVPYDIVYYGSRIAWYDADKSLISVRDNNNAVITSPSNAFYMRFNTSSLYGTTYKHNIQICLNSLPDAVKTTYHPNMTDTLTLPEPVTLKGAGSVADTDELNVEVLVDGVKVNRRRQTMRIGTYTFTGNEIWAQSGSCYICQTALPNAWHPSSTNYYWLANIQHNYLLVNNWQNLDSGADGIGLTFNDAKIIISGTAYANRANLVGTKLNYELAEESVTLLDPIYDPFIQVEGGGTIKPVQSQETKIDSAMTVTYVNKITE